MKQSVISRLWCQRNMNHWCRETAFSNVFQLIKCIYSFALIFSFSWRGRIRMLHKLQCCHNILSLWGPISKRFWVQFEDFRAIVTALITELHELNFINWPLRGPSGNTDKLLNLHRRICQLQTLDYLCLFMARSSSSMGAEPDLCC